jgi:hypothetical protein
MSLLGLIDLKVINLSIGMKPVSLFRHEIQSKLIDGTENTLFFIE